MRPLSVKRSVLTLATLIGAACSSSTSPNTPTAPLIYALVTSVGSGPNPLHWLEQVQVLNGAGTAVNGSALVSVNGTVLAFDSTTGSYFGYRIIAPGETVTLNVTVGSTMYTAQGVQFTTFPTITTTADSAVWPRSAANIVTWTAGAPTTGASYLLGLYSSNGRCQYPASLCPKETPAATSTLTDTIAANTIVAPAGVYQLGVGIGTTGINIGAPGTGIQIPGAGTGSGLWIGAVSYVTVIVQ